MQKKLTGKTKNLSQWEERVGLEDEKSFYRYRQNRKKKESQWEEEKSWAVEEDEKSFYRYCFLFEDEKSVYC